MKVIRNAFSEPDHLRLTRRLKRVGGADLSDQDAAELADGDFEHVRGLAVPAQLAVMALVKPDSPALGMLEKIVGTTVDYVGIAFLDRARAAGRPVVRVVGSDRAPIGTGTMVSRHLVLTNHHVTEDERQAASQLIQFDYELAADGTPVALTEFRLDPDSFFRTSAVDDLDYTLVAVGGRVSGARELAAFGFVPLSSAGDKHAEGDFVTIVEHPDGTYKQIALRENRVIGRGQSGKTLHYGADTEGGSSGSPVFNDQFELVALHHAGGARNDTMLDTGQPVPADSNEGIRISAITTQLTGYAATLTGAARELLTDALDPPPSRPSIVLPQPESTAVAPSNGATGAVAGGSSGTIELVIPLVWDVRLGMPRIGAGAASPATVAPSLPAPADTDETGIPGLERNNPPDPNYSNRPGYSERFLGADNVVPLPLLGPEILPLAAAVPDAGNELRYLHFSTVQNSQRKLPFFTAVNIDGAHAPKSINRKTGEIDFGDGLEASETWYVDTRLTGDLQVTDAFYGHQAFRMFDRGHMVRRLDPAWGEKATVMRASDDTFHFTNCCPQAWKFNEQVKYWAGIEDYVLENAKAAKSRVSVFSGPIFTNEDPVFWGVEVPKAFWKIVVHVDRDLGLRATGFIADQSDFLTTPQPELEAYTGDWGDLKKVKAYTASIADIASRTHLDFGTLPDHDSYAPTEAAEPRPITSFAEVGL